jgi:hypothetical protein
MPSIKTTSVCIMLLCPTERACTSADFQELKSLYGKFSTDGCAFPDSLDSSLLQAAQADPTTVFYYQVDPDVGRGCRRSLVSAVAVTINPDASWCLLQHVVSPLARRVSFLADVLTQLERCYSYTLCTASVRPSYLPSMAELGESFYRYLRLPSHPP